MPNTFPNFQDHFISSLPQRSHCRAKRSVEGFALETRPCERCAAAVARLGDRIETVATALRSGRPWEEILAAAREGNADLIVIGTHGRKGLPRALLGSVAEKVVRMSPVPVLTVRA